MEVNRFRADEGEEFDCNCPNPKAAVDGNASAGWQFSPMVGREKRLLHFACRGSLQLENLQGRHRTRAKQGNEIAFRGQPFGR